MLGSEDNFPPMLFAVIYDRHFGYRALSLNVGRGLAHRWAQISDAAFSDSHCESLFQMFAQPGENSHDLANGFERSIDIVVKRAVDGVELDRQV